MELVDFREGGYAAFIWGGFGGGGAARKSGVAGLRIYGGALAGVDAAAGCAWTRN